MQLTGIAIIAAAVLAYALISRRLERTPVTLPIVFTGFGWLIGSGGLHLAPIETDHGAIHLIAELTLILVLFSDAARIDVRRLAVDHTLPLRMLAIGMPLTVLIGTAFAMIIFPEATLAMALLVAAILAPTDAALGQSVVSAKQVPVRIRQALNVESGLNDGLALPLVLIAALLLAPMEGAGSASSLAVFALLQVTLGPLAGLFVGYIGARLIDKGAERGWMAEPFQGLAVLAVAILAFAIAELIGGNGFIAAFAGGLVFGATVSHRCSFVFEFMESEGQLLTVIVFLVFGAVMLPDALHHATWGTLLLALLFLTIVRMVPIAIALTRTGLSYQSKAFLGWFGPRGIASILFALLIVEREAIPGGDEILACVVITVALSIVLHGATAAPLSAAYGKFIDRTGECAEREPVSAFRLRHGDGDEGADAG